MTLLRQSIWVLCVNDANQYFQQGDELDPWIIDYHAPVDNGMNPPFLDQRQEWGAACHIEVL